MEKLKTPSAAHNGIVLPYLVIILPVFLVVIAFAVSLLYIKYLDVKYQTLSDISAKIGARETCSSKECFNKSRITALRYIERELTGSEGSLDEAQNSTEWETEGVKIKIERGRWIDSFEVLEHEWQELNPGTPNFMVYNALKISLERESILSFLPSFLYGALSVSSESISVAKPPSKGECSAPFAIPLCSMLDQDGGFDQKMICRADRLFTESNRYCPPGENCNVIPDFNYSLIPNVMDVMTALNVEHWDYLNWGPGPIETPQGLSINSCSYLSPSYEVPSQNFGVVGAPGVVGEASIDAVLPILNSENGCLGDTKIGDSFGVLKNGLTDISLKDRLSNLVMGHNESSVNFRSLESDIIQFTNRSFISDRDQSFCSEDVRRPRINQFGVCGSARTGWGTDWNHFQGVALESNGGCSPDLGIMPDSNVWKARVPIIASSEGCSGTVSASTEYKIVGFITAYIYDFDIGSVASLPSISSTSEELRSCAGLIQEDFNPSTQNPFSFTTPAESVRPCNLVRARIDCRSKVFPSADDTAENEPYLVR